MRLRWLLLPLLLVSGCTDSLGLGSSCTAEKTEVRLREGGAPASTQKDELAGNYTERWYYYVAGRTRVYTFRWGVSYAACEVEGPASFARIPLWSKG